MVCFILISFRASIILFYRCHVAFDLTVASFLFFVCSHVDIHRALTSPYLRALFFLALALFKWFIRPSAPLSDDADPSAWTYAYAILTAYAVLVLAHTVFAVYYFAGAWYEGGALILYGWSVRGKPVVSSGESDNASDSAEMGEGAACSFEGDNAV